MKKALGSIGIIAVIIGIFTGLIIGAFYLWQDTYVPVEIYSRSMTNTADSDTVPPHFVMDLKLRNRVSGEFYQTRRAVDSYQSSVNELLPGSQVWWNLEKGSISSTPLSTSLCWVIALSIILSVIISLIVVRAFLDWCDEYDRKKRLQQR